MAAILANCHSISMDWFNLIITLKQFRKSLNFRWDVGILSSKMFFSVQYCTLYSMELPQSLLETERQKGCTVDALSCGKDLNHWIKRQLLPDF